MNVIYRTPNRRNRHTRRRHSRRRHRRRHRQVCHNGVSALSRTLYRLPYDVRLHKLSSYCKALAGAAVET